MNITGNVLEETKKIDDCSQDIIFSDPPYNLGSEWYMADNGKPECKKASDFMNKWQGLTGPDLEQLFKDFLRVLKHGGYCVFAGQMRQAMPFQYYAIAAGFDMIEPIYSYSISNFPKALDIGKALDKHYGREQEVVGQGKSGNQGHQRFSKMNIDIGNGRTIDNRDSEKAIKYNDKEGFNITAPASDLAKKYNGIKSSICPLKQTTEVWFIFRKPFKHKTIVQDIIAYEDGDETIAPSGLNIDRSRVPTSKIYTYKRKGGNTGHLCWSGLNVDIGAQSHEQGRYPAQLFLDGSISYKREEIDLDNIDFLEFIGIDIRAIFYMDHEKALDYVCDVMDKFDVSKLLDEQSGVSISKKGKVSNKGTIWGSKDETIKIMGHDDIGGSSRILHNASFTLEELFQHIYYSKASGFERNSLDEQKMNNLKRFGSGNYSQSPACSICQKTINGINNHDECEKEPRYKIEYIRKEENNMHRNNHPTMKSLKLLYNIIQLFNTVDIEKKKILIPFSGVSSEKIAWLAHGASEKNITAIEISPEYNEIGASREKFWIENNFFFRDDKIMQSKIKTSIEKEDKIKNTGQANLF